MAVTSLDSLVWLCLEAVDPSLALQWLSTTVASYESLIHLCVCTFHPTYYTVGVQRARSWTRYDDRFQSIHEGIYPSNKILMLPHCPGQRYYLGGMECTPLHWTKCTPPPRIHSSGSLGWTSIQYLASYTSRRIMSSWKVCQICTTLYPLPCILSYDVVRLSTVKSHHWSCAIKCTHLVIVRNLSKSSRA